MYKIEDIINKVHCADCLEFMKDMPDKSVDLVLTDPPYGINYKGIEASKKKGLGVVFDKIENDKGKLDLKMVLNFSCPKIIFGAEYYLSQIPHNKGTWICWDKRLTEKADKMIGNPFELAWYSENTNYRIYRILHGGVVNADNWLKQGIQRFHPTQKPVRLMELIIKDFTEEGQTILDPFLGSGTTAVAAQNLKRNFIGIEISSEYCKIAEQRLRQKPLL